MIPVYLSAFLFIALPACKKSRGTISAMNETSKMAIVPDVEAQRVYAKPFNEEETSVERSIGILSSGFKVDAVLALYADQHSASPAVKRFTRSLADKSSSQGLRLRDLDSAFNFPVSAEISSSHKKQLSLLRGKRKKIFDDAYAGFIADHLTERRKAAEELIVSAEDRSVKGFSEDYLKFLLKSESKLKQLTSGKK